MPRRHNGKIGGALWEAGDIEKELECITSGSSLGRAEQRVLLTMFTTVPGQS